MSTQEVANKLVDLCRKGENETAIKELYAANVVSIEPAGAQAPPRLEGIEAVAQKSVEWASMVEEFHGSTISDPIVAGNHFSISMNMDITMKGAGRIAMEEVCVYEVTDGKISTEQFFYPTGG